MVFFSSSNPEILLSKFNFEVFSFLILNKFWTIYILLIYA